MTIDMIHHLGPTPSNLAQSGRRDQRRIEAALFTGGQFSSLRTPTATVTRKRITVKSLAELRRKTPLVQQVLGKAALKTSNDILTDHRQELERTAQNSQTSHIPLL